MGGWHKGCPWHCPGIPGTTLGPVDSWLGLAPGERVPEEARNEE